MGSRYELVYSPHIANVDLWKTSGHYDFYAESMFDQIKVPPWFDRECHGAPRRRCDHAQSLIQVLRRIRVARTASLRRQMDARREWASGAGGADSADA